MLVELPWAASETQPSTPADAPHLRFLVRDFVSSIAFLKGKPRLNQTSWKTRFLTHQICLSLNRKKHQLSERPLACARPCRIAGACLRVNTCALRVSPFTHGFQGWPARRTTRQGFSPPRPEGLASSETSQRSGTGSGAHPALTIWLPALHHRNYHRGTAISKAMGSRQLKPIPK